jgi:hypothetical protein
MHIPTEILDFVDFVGAEIVFKDSYRGVTSYHCEQRLGVRDSSLPFDFQVRVNKEYMATLVFADRSGKTVTKNLFFLDTEDSIPACEDADVTDHLDFASILFLFAHIQMHSLAAMFPMYSWQLA